MLYSRLNIIFIQLSGVLLAGILLIGCDRNISRIPGTEGAAPQSISISPDEQWLLYFEHAQASNYPPNTRANDRFAYVVASLNLRTGAQVIHEVDSIPRDKVWQPSGPEPHIYQAWWCIHNWFHPAGWFDGRFYVDAVFGYEINPREPEIRVSTKGKGSRRCLDCVSETEIRKFAGAQDLWQVHKREPAHVAPITAANGEVRAIYFYRIDRKGPGTGVYRVDGTGATSLIMPAPADRGLQRYDIEAIRVSQDEVLLAYVVYKRRAGVLGGGEEDVHVRSIETGKEFRIGTFTHVSNLLFGLDHRTLYFAATGGVYRVDLSKFTGR